MLTFILKNCHILLKLIIRIYLVVVNVCYFLARNIIVVSVFCIEKFCAFLKMISCKIVYNCQIFSWCLIF